MAYDANFPQDDSYLADFPAGEREQNKQLKEGQIVDAGMLQGLTAGNNSGQIPVSNGIENTNLNAAMLNGKTSSYFSPSTHTHELATTSSNGFMSNADKLKLDSIASGATGSQNVFYNIKVGQSYLQPESTVDVLEFSAGQNISITPDTLNDKITIAVSGTVNSAVKAIQDNDGNTISSTYLKRSGGTMNGNIDASGYVITAQTFSGNLNGNANTATNAVNSTNAVNAQKATADSRGQEIDSTYVKNVTSDGSKITVTKGDDSSTQITVTDLNKVYPVGSIYMSVLSTNPAELFGIGTWEAMPAGRVLLAQGQSDWGVNYAAGSTGGEHQHQLTVGELPSHNHAASINTTGAHTHTVTSRLPIPTGDSKIITYGNVHPSNTSINTTTSSSGNHSHTITVNNNGSNQAHNNLQPYISVYMWQRTE